MDEVLLFHIPDHPYPNKPILAYHDLNVDRLQWAKENAQLGRKVSDLLDVEVDSIIMKDDVDDQC